VVDTEHGSSSVPVRMSPLTNTDTSGINPDDATLVLQQRASGAMVQVFARKLRMQGVAAVLLGAEPGKATVTERWTALPLAPGQWMLSAAAGGDGNFLQALAAELGDTVYLSEQSHGRVIIRVSGLQARELMQKGCRLDLHPTVVSAGFCAQTSIAQTGVLIHQVDDAPTYDLHIYSGFAQSFWHWLTGAAAALGYRVDS